MQPAFDPYYRWLGIGPEEQPPNYYQLLGLRLFEASPDVIETAADRQMRHVHTFKVGQYSAQSQALLNEIAAARLCLLAPDKKAEYDAALRAASPASPPPLPPPVPPPVARAPVAAVPQAVAVAEAAPPAPLINTQRSVTGQAYRNRRSLAHSSGAMLAVVLAAIGVFATAAWLVWRSQPVAPQLPAVANQNLPEGQTLRLKLAPAGPHKPGELVFDVLKDSPTGVKLDKSDGDLSWTPDERQGPGTHHIHVRCSVAGSPHLYDEATFEVVVTEVHQPPHLDRIELKPTGNGAYSVKLLGKDLDLPRGKVTYSLQIVPAPAAAPTLIPESGLFFWRPAKDDLGKTFHMTFRAAKAGQPQVFSEQSTKVELRPGGAGTTSIGALAPEPDA